MIAGSTAAGTTGPALQEAHASNIGAELLAVGLGQLLR
jgi:hypothetical protein